MLRYKAYVHIEVSLNRVPTGIGNCYTLNAYPLDPGLPGGM